MDYIRGSAAAVQYIESRLDERFVVSTVAVYELFIGRLKNGHDATLTHFKRKFDWATEVELTAAHALEGARVQRELTERGQRIQQPDMLLAGVARSMDVPVVSSDHDFEKVERLRVVNHRDEYHGS